MKRQQMTGNEDVLNIYLGGFIIARLLLQNDQIFLQYSQDWQKSGYAISSTEIEKRLDERDEYSLIIWDGKPRLSMAGVQDKINITINSNGQMGFGEGKLISTHILKFEKQKLSHLVINEYTTMQLAKQC